MTCRHIEFSNSSLHNSHSCNTLLSRKISVLANQIVIRSNLIFLFFRIRQQIVTIYHRPGFKSHLRHWANRSQSVNLLTDIYDDDVWKTLKESFKVDSLNFF